MFPKLVADIDSSVASFLQSTEHVIDEIKYDKEVEIRYDSRGNINGVCGNWYQLEWTWSKIDRIMQQQSKIHKRAARNHTDRQLSRNREENKVTHLDEDTDDVRARRPGFPSSVEKGEPRQSSISSTPDVLPTKSNAYSKYRERGRSQSDSDDDDHIQRYAVRKGHGETNRDDKEKTPQRQEARKESRGHERVSVEEGARGSGSYNDRSAPSYDDDGDVVVATRDQRQEEQSSWSNTVDIIKDDPHDVKSIDFRFGPLLVNVYTGSITLEETDVIVNAAMGPLQHAGGVAKAISDAASLELDKQCEAYVNKYGYVPTSGVMHTCAGGKLSPRIQHVIHAVGPIWMKTSSREEILYVLTNTFNNAFVYANDVLKVTSLAAPLISSGK